MKKWLTALLIFMVALGIVGCTRTETDSNEPSAGEDIDWAFYQQRAEDFITAMLVGDLDRAYAMFDATMKNAIPASALQTDIWDVITAQAGEFEAIHEIEPSLIDGYYICFTTSRHEYSGVTLRIVFDEGGLIAGLFIDGYPSLSEEIAQDAGLNQIPVVIGEGTDFPLKGMLSLPDNPAGKVPAVVLVHGSGPQDMDETLYGNQPFRDIAEYLTSEGIAVLRYDKRSLSYGAELVQQFGNSLTVWEEVIEDAIMAAELLKADSRIDENRVYILGHSLGGMLAPRIHAEGGDFAGMILLAGSPRSLLEITYDQQMAYINEMPEGEEKTAALAQMEGYDEQINTLMSLPDETLKNMPVSGGMSFYYYKEMDAHPASGYLKGLEIPLLILQGDKDFQVYADTDFVLWQSLLEGKENAAFKLYPGLNHLFMAATGSTIADYQEEYKIPGHVEQQVLLDIAQWIKAN